MLLLLPAIISLSYSFVAAGEVAVAANDIKIYQCFLYIFLTLCPAPAPRPSSPPPCPCPPTRGRLPPRRRRRRSARTGAGPEPASRRWRHCPASTSSTCGSGRSGRSAPRRPPRRSCAPRRPRGRCALLKQFYHWSVVSFSLS